MALTEFLILRKPRSGCLEERTALIQPIVNSFTRSYAGMTRRCGWLTSGAVIIAFLIASTVQAACAGVCRLDHVSRPFELSDREPGGGAHRHRLQRRDPGCGHPGHRDDEQRPS